MPIYICIYIYISLLYTSHGPSHNVIRHYMEARKIDTDITCAITYDINVGIYLIFKYVHNLDGKHAETPGQSGCTLHEEGEHCESILISRMYMSLDRGCASLRYRLLAVATHTQYIDKCIIASHSASALPAQCTVFLIQLDSLQNICVCIYI